MATILRIPSTGKTSYQARLPVAHDPDVRAKPQSSSPRAANGPPSRDGANKALDPHIAAAHLLPFGSLTTSLTSKREALWALRTPASRRGCLSRGFAVLLASPIVASGLVR
jgi:hypothetical protein